MHTGKIGDLCRAELDLDKTLSSGQVFRWSKNDDNSWRGIAEGDRRMRLLQEASGTLYWQGDGIDVADVENGVRRFLRLDNDRFCLRSLADSWAKSDPFFADAWAKTPGIRVLRQSPNECFFSFLCASVAPIPRIATMLRAVAGRFGTDLGDGYTLFPTPQQLATAQESELRDLGLGFRAKRIVHAARRFAEQPPDHLLQLRTADHETVRQTLTPFFGVGAKIADCVALFSLDKDRAIPVDTHIWRLATLRYLPELHGKSLTAANYDLVHRAFYDRFGDYAGWAQQTLFYRATVGNRNEPA